MKWFFPARPVRRGFILLRSEWQGIAIEGALGRGLVCSFAANQPPPQSKTSQKAVIPSYNPFLNGHNEGMTESGLKGLYILVQGKATARSVALGWRSRIEIDRELAWIEK